MRTSGPLGTPADFERALDYAKQGAIASCTGLSVEVEAALDAVRAAAPNPPKQLIDNAMDTYLHSVIHRSQESSEHQ
jgi:hypothetical protein